MSKNASILERRFVPKDVLVMKEGEEATCAYLIQSGTVEVYTELEGKKISLAKLDTGQIFGEMALVFDEPRSASVRTLEDCNLIILTRQSFQQKLEKSDPTINAIVHMFTKRMMSANNTVINKKSDLSDLVETSQTIYQNVLAALPRAQQRTFQNAVLPKLDDFMNAVRSFQDRFAK